MKNILVVSDNFRLTKYFQDECDSQNLRGVANFFYRYSSSNKSPSAMIELGAAAIDMKNSSDVTYAKENFDLILSLHCKQIFPSDLVSSVTCINVHPGFNPHNRGWYPQVFSIINCNPVGATIHLMDEHVDHGAILAQREVCISQGDTSFDVYEKVFIAEKDLLKENLLDIINNDFSVKSAVCEGNFNSLQDFRELCRLDMESIGSLGDHIKLLRALSHAEFKNAYFLSDEGKKIFVRVLLEESSS